MALRARGWHVAYIDPNVSPGEALRAGAADERAETFRGAPIVIVATPVDAALELIRQMPEIPVTSVCSVMKPLREAADARRLPFVAGHPLAGSHERSLAAARADLFHGHRWFIDRSDATVERVVTECGAIADVVDADEHDRAVALTSHLPQILSTALAAAMTGEDLRFAGSGLRTFLRLAGSDASVWSSVIASNRDNIARRADVVNDLVRRILEDDPSPVFEQARAVWKRLGDER